MKYTAALATLLGTSVAVDKGFNYGATNSDGSCRDESYFQSAFTTAQNLVGNSGFTSARLYTTIQCGSTNSPISAIQAAINTDTTLLLGLWASAGQDTINNELAALSSAINTYGTSFTSRVVGISVGSEDLYRASAQGQANNAGVGADAATIESYISQVKSAISSTPLNGVPVGHVDTWTAWVDGANAGVISASDFIGHNGFPYFETTLANSIENGQSVFENSLSATEGVAQGKPVWVTETGWPVSGPASGQAVASTANAQSYWKSVGCSLFGSRSTWWYTLSDGNANQQEVSFGISDGIPPSTTPLFDISC